MISQTYLVPADQSDPLTQRPVMTETAAIVASPPATITSEYQLFNLGQNFMTHDDVITIHGAAVLSARAVVLEALAGRRRESEYNSYYNAYLLGQLSDEEFERISEQFLVTESYSDAELEERIRILEDETGASCPAEQIAFIFSSPLSQVRRVTRRT